MTILTRIYRQPAKLLALFGTVLTVLTAADVLTADGAAIALGVITALIGALSYIVTPTTEVVVQDTPGVPGLRAGAASRIETGTQVNVKVEAIE